MNEHIIKLALEAGFLRDNGGVYQPDSGEILNEGMPVSLRGTQDAQKLGVAAIFQEPMVFPDLNVAENIFISHASLGEIFLQADGHKRRKPSHLAADGFRRKGSAGRRRDRRFTPGAWSCAGR